MNKHFKIRLWVVGLITFILFGAFKINDYKKINNGAPVSPDNYRANLKTIISQLLIKYPGCKIVVNFPLWYSPNTYNGSMYLAEGLARLKTYFPEIRELVRGYSKSNPGQVFRGYVSGFNYFKKNHEDAMKHEDGHQGVFFLHPNEKGASHLGLLWGKAIYRALKK